MNFFAKGSQGWEHTIHGVTKMRVCTHSIPVYKLSKLKRFGDPPDMWAADTKFLGYKEVAK